MLGFGDHSAAAAAKSLQSCLTLRDPIDSSPPGSPVPGILQARTLEWVAISFSNAWKWKVKIESEVAQSYPTCSDPMDCSLPGSSIHRIFQARVLEWGAIALSRDQSKDLLFLHAVLWDGKKVESFTRRCELICSVTNKYRWSYFLLLFSRLYSNEQHTLEAKPAQLFYASYNLTSENTKNSKVNTWSPIHSSIHWESLSNSSSSYSLGPSAIWDKLLWGLQQLEESTWEGAWDKMSKTKVLSIFISTAFLFFLSFSFLSFSFSLNNLP